MLILDFKLYAMGIKITQGFLFLVLTLLCLSCQPAQERQKEHAIGLRKETAQAFEKNELNDELALEAAEALEGYALDWPADSLDNPSFLYDAMQLYTQSGHFDRALAAADTLMRRYPGHKLTPYTLHYKAYFIYENGLGDTENAGKLYRAFLEKYPGHPELTSVVLFSLEHLGKDDSEILDEILKKKSGKDED